MGFFCFGSRALISPGSPNVVPPRKNKEVKSYRSDIQYSSVVRSIGMYYVELCTVCMYVCVDPWPCACCTCCCAIFSCHPLFVFFRTSSLETWTRFTLMAPIRKKRARPCCGIMATPIQTLAPCRWVIFDYRYFAISKYLIAFFFFKRFFSFIFASYPGHASEFYFQ